MINYKSFSSRRAITCASLLVPALALVFCYPLCLAQPPSTPEEAEKLWNSIPKVQMQGGLKAYWNVTAVDPIKKVHDRQAREHGFGVVTLKMSYSDYPGKQKQNIYRFLETNSKNPWDRPKYFERIVKQNILAPNPPENLLVHDIEFKFEHDAEVAERDAAIRASSGVSQEGAFQPAYYKAWAQWFADPCRWAKEIYPEIPIGIYGIQPFSRDYFGVRNKTSEQIDERHKNELLIWKNIDPVVDYYTSSVYFFDEQPDSIYYMAANIEENYYRTRTFGNKPLYAYVMLRFHPGTKEKKEVEDYQTEASAVIPYFTGAKGIVFYHSLRSAPFPTGLPLFMKSLGRVARISEALGKAQLMKDEPVSEVWRKKTPLIRRMKVTETEWYVLLANPWQGEGDSKMVSVQCGGHTVPLSVKGKHTEIYHITQGTATRIEME